MGVKSDKNRNYNRYFHSQIDILCYTDTMQPERKFWPEWARFLHLWGLDNVAAVLLETAGPLTIILAQLVYFSQPLIGQGEAAGRLQALAGLFEDQKESRSFANYLREEKPA